jgi:rhomboid protease GluP
MLGRQRSGSVVCRSCGRLVGVNDAQCANCGAARPALWGFAPLLRKWGDETVATQLIVFVCAVLYMLTLATDLGGIRNQGLFSLLAPSLESLVRFGASGTEPVLRWQRWWTPLSAGWLHGGLLHVGFNLYWLLQIGPLVAGFYGAGRMVVIYTVASVCGFLASTFATFMPSIVRTIFGSGHFSMGASAGLFGLLAALVWYGRRSGSRELSRQVWTWVLFLGLFGFLMRGVDNWAHLGGFVGGLAICRLLDPLKPERLDHLAAAVVCLLLTAGAIVASLVVPLPPPPPLPLLP